MRARIRVKPYGIESPAVKYFDLTVLTGDEARQMPRSLRTSEGAYVDLSSLRRSRRQCETYSEFHDPNEFVVETDDKETLAAILECPIDEPGLENWKDESVEPSRADESLGDDDSVLHCKNCNGLTDHRRITDEHAGELWICSSCGYKTIRDESDNWAEEPARRSGCLGLILMVSFVCLFVAIVCTVMA